MPDDPDLTPDPLVEAGAPNVVAIEGLLGESDDGGSVRVFLDIDFATYYDIPRDAIVSRERVPAERSSLGVDASRVLVRRDTSLVVHRVASRPVEHEFLAGDFTAPNSFRSLPLAGRGTVSPMYIPTYTIHGHVCCQTPSNGCYAVAHDTTGGGWPTCGGGCTIAKPCIC